MAKAGSRITAGKVQEAFQTFQVNAKEVGFTVDGWDLIPPQFVGGAWCLVDRGHDGHSHTETPFPTHLGTSNREAHNVLRAMARTLFAVGHLHELSSE